jgi:hypothetical protein
MKICLEIFLEFSRMHENKIFFIFLKGAINLKYLRFFDFFFVNILEKIRYFNTGFVSYSVSIQPNIKQNW